MLKETERSEIKMCGLRAGLKSAHALGYVENTGLPYPEKTWFNAPKVGEGNFASNFEDCKADLQWYGCQVPEEYKEPLQEREKRGKDWKDVELLKKIEKQRPILQEYFKTTKIEYDRKEVLLNVWNIFAKHNVVATTGDKEKDIEKALFFDVKIRDEVIHDFASEDIGNWEEEPWNALEKAACHDLVNGADLEKVAVRVKRAQYVISMAKVAGRYLAQCVKNKEFAGQRIVLSSILLGQEQISLGYDRYWVAMCPHTRVVTYRAMVGAYARGVKEEGDFSLVDAFKAGGMVTPPKGKVCWRNVEAAYEEYMPKELGKMVKKKMGEARANFSYPHRPGEQLEEMKAWCDVTTYDWYALCGPKSEELSRHAVGALMLGYECEVLVDMCPETTYEEYIRFIAKGVDIIPHMDTKELTAGAFASHACGVKGFEGLEWLNEAIDEHVKAKKSDWGPRSIDGAAYLMFLGINEGCRQPSIQYSKLRLEAEINLMAAHEAAGLFRHGMENDAMSRGMLDKDSKTTSFAMMIDKLGEDAVKIAIEMGPPHNTGYMLTCFGYLLFNLVGSSSMIRWAAGLKPRCESIARNPEALISEATEKPKNQQQLSRDMQKVSALAAHRAFRLGVVNSYPKTHPHKEGGECDCWDCIAGPIPKCQYCGC